MKNIYIAALTVFTLTNTSLAGVGGHGEQDQHWTSPESAKQVKNPIKSNRRSINKGEVTFMQSCASCHGVNADGNGSLAINLHTKPTNLRMMAGMHSDGEFAWKIANGKGAMPAWKGVLSETEIWNAVNFIQSMTDHSKMDMSGMDHSKMNMKGMDHSSTEDSHGH
jgi:mono/diheme cytochrome c family protein